MAFDPIPARRRRSGSPDLPLLQAPSHTSGGQVVARLPGSRHTGRPHLDAPPVGRPQLAHAVYFLVKLPDGRPGIVAAADRTQVWAPPRSALHAAPAAGASAFQEGSRPSQAAAPDATRVQLPHYAARPYQMVAYGPSWWERLRAALQPKAGFILYSEEADTSAEAIEFRSHSRKGYVYDGLDVTRLKQAMDMSTEAWEHPEEAERLLNWLLRLSKNMVATATKVKDVASAAKGLKESLTQEPEVKVVVYKPLSSSYSGLKTTVSQIDSMRQLPSPRATVAGGAGFVRVANGASDDSLWRESYYDKNGKVLGRITARPPRRR